MRIYDLTKTKGCDMLFLSKMRIIWRILENLARQMLFSKLRIPDIRPVSIRFTQFTTL